MSTPTDLTQKLPSSAAGPAATGNALPAVRRVVTGNAPDGKSIFLSDGEPPREVRFDTLPGQEYVELWSTDGLPSLPTDGKDPTIGMASFVPPPGGTRFGIVVIPPDSEVMDAVVKAGGPAAILEEFHAKLPGLAEASEVDHPGMHTTSTVDYDVIVSGEVWLELDDGAEVHLRQGDFIVQHGVRHAWRNKSAAPCVLAYVMVGATRT